MGDRALVIFSDGKTVSPTVYLHWNGTEVPKWIEELKALMVGREGDQKYSVARFVGICHGNINGNLSIGCWNTDQDIQAATNTVLFEPTQHTVARKAAYDVLTNHSHGDAGVVLVNVKDFSWQAFGGYLERVEQAA